MEHLIVTGNVATGKSFITEIILHSFEDVVLYPEFIYQDSFAMELMKRKFQNKLSALTFQNYILDKWCLNIKMNESMSGIKLYERLPDDAVKIFAKLYLNKSEYMIQKERLKQINLNVPSYHHMNKLNCTWIRYSNEWDRDINELIKLIKTIKTKFVVIEVKSKSAFDNYRHRNRQEEFYTLEEINKLQEIYDEFTEKQVMKIGCEIIEM